MSESWSGEADPSEMFASFSTFGKVQNDYLIPWLTSVSDLTEDEIVKAKALDDRVPCQLLEAATGLPANLRCLPQLR
eukprot:12587529-Alexandrium_andersonii.AAC.1